MRPDTMGFAPLRFPAGALRVVTLFGTNDAEVTAGESLAAGKTVALVEALGGLAAAGLAVNLPGEYQPDGGSQGVIE